MRNFFKRPTDKTPGIRGSGKRVRSTAPGIEGRVVVPSASASLASTPPMSQKDRDAFIALAEKAKLRPAMSETDKAKIDRLLETILSENEDIAKQMKNEDFMTRAKAAMEWHRIVRADQRVENFLTNFPNYEYETLRDSFARVKDNS